MEVALVLAAIEMPAEVETALDETDAVVAAVLVANGRETGAEETEEEK